MGNKTQTQTSQQSTTPINTAALQQIYGQVSNAAQTPYTPYTGELTAGINGQQTAGINTINNASNSAQPYYSQAAGLASGAANPLTAAQIQQYQNPYTQNVVNATQAQFNDLNGQQQNSLKGTAAQQGALGGDRQAVAQSQLAGQQALNEAPTIANLYANSYNSGLATAGQQFQQNPLAASSAISGIGTNIENAGLAGGSAQLAAGTQQQQTQQAADTANYGQYQAQQAFPYQQAAYLEQYGLPSALAQGTTSNGTQTTQGPTSLSQILGLGTLGVGALGNSSVQSGLGYLGGLVGAKDGGDIGYAPGGNVGYVTSPHGYIMGSQGYIPNTQPSQAKLRVPGQNDSVVPSLKYLGQQQTSTNPMSTLSALGNNNSNPAYGGGNMLSDAYGGSSSNPLAGLDAGDYGQGYEIGGLVHAIHTIHKTIKRSRGGSVTGSTPFQTFDDGGPASFDDRFMAAFPNGQSLSDGSAGIPVVPDAPPIDTSVYTPDNPLRMPDEASVQAWRDNVDQPNPAVVADSGMPDADGTAPNPMSNPASLPPQITNPDNTPDSSALAYDGNNIHGPASSPMGANGLPTVTAPIGQPTDDQSGSSRFPHFSDKVSNALMAAGLGILASPSHFTGVAIGQGGLQGLKSLSDANKAEQDAAEKAQTRAQEQQRIDLQAKQIANQIQTSQRTAASAPLVPGPNGQMIPNQAYLAEKKQETDITQKDNWAPIGTVMVPTANGDVAHPLVMNKADHSVVDAVTGKPPASDARVSPTSSGGRGAVDPVVVQHVVNGITSGKQPPTLTGLYGMSGAVRAGLDESGFDLGKSQLQWKQAEKQVATLNGPQMTRFVGLANSVTNTIDEVNTLAQKMQNSGIPLLNHAKLAAYMQAEGNSPNGQLAAQYIGSVNTLKEEFANLANGGYAPTDPAWKLANEQINGDYGWKQLGSSLKEVQRLINYRVNAIPNLATMGPGAANRYTGQQGMPLTSNQTGGSGAPAAPAPPPIPPAPQRVVGQVYPTPKGPAKWTGQGWLPQ